MSAGPGDRLTASLRELLRLASIKKLESREQLGFVVLATYLRSADFAGLSCQGSFQEADRLPADTGAPVFPRHRRCGVQAIIFAAPGDGHSGPEEATAETGISRLFGSVAHWLSAGNSLTAPWIAC